MSKTTPYFLFEGTCAEAMQFYHDCLGGELSLTKVSDSPMSAQFPAELQDRVLNAHLVKDDIELSASDWLMPQRQPIRGNMTCAYISGATHDELVEYFNKLSVGAPAGTLDAPQAMPFGTYAALTDKYGVRWMFQGAPKQ